MSLHSIKKITRGLRSLTFVSELSVNPQSKLNRLENVFNALGYSVRYEKGNFRSGSCFILDSHVVVINKFLTSEQKVEALTAIIGDTQIDENLLDDQQRKWVHTLKSFNSES